jgi:two-component sensor histidine kinase
MWDRIAQERTDLSEAERNHLGRIVAHWSLIADLGLGDLILWLPTWNEAGTVAAALVRPTTSPTSVPEDVVGTFMPKGRERDLDQALAFGRVMGQAYPVWCGERVIAVVARYASATRRVAGHLEEIYLGTAKDLLSMLVDGSFPPTALDETGAESPRVGDGLIRLDAHGSVEYASPNAVSALRRLGMATSVLGLEFASVATRLSHRQGPVDETLPALARGRVAGQADLANAQATVQVQGIPLLSGADQVGALILVRDVTDLRHREQALLSKDATIREIHHRVKNNLQTVAALLRLQARRAASDETRAALGEAELRVASIALVHETMSRQPGDDVAFDEIVDRIIGLVADLAPAYAQGQEPPRLVREGSSGLLVGEVATALAMCVSELLHNAVEHASASQITVRLASQESAVSVEVCDDGTGLPAGFTVQGAGLGLQIVQSLATGELRGTFTMAVSPDGGTCAVIRVPGGEP